jgi:hypothetical protein
MTGLANQTRAREHRPTIEINPGTTSKLSSEEEVCRWALRLLLPLILALCGQLIFWMWFDDVYGPNTWSIVGGSLLAAVTIPVALWTWYSWLPDEAETFAGTTLSLRDVCIGLLAFAALAGGTRLHDGEGVPAAVQIAQSEATHVVAVEPPPAVAPHVAE